MNFRFSDAWLHPRKNRIGTRISRTIRKILRRWAGSGFMSETRNWKFETRKSKLEIRAKSRASQNRNSGIEARVASRVSNFEFGPKNLPKGHSSQCATLRRQ